MRKKQSNFNVNENREMDERTKQKNGKPTFAFAALLRKDFFILPHSKTSPGFALGLRLHLVFRIER